MAIDFARVATAALSSAERLCADWLGGKRSGHEWTGAKRANGGPGDSWSVNLNTGEWGHFGSDERGGDLISLYAAIHHMSQAAAAEQVAHLVGIGNGAGAPARTEQPAGAAPADVALPGPHSQHGAYSALYRYYTATGELAFLVARYDLPSGKQFCPYTWRAGRWSAKAYPAPRPLYGLPGLTAGPTLPVLVVEGEKCRDAAATALKGYACVSWAGGAQAVKSADWSPLSGREVLLWPDADGPGRAAMAGLAAQLLPTASRVQVLDTTHEPPGWDVADALETGWSSRDITSWIGKHRKGVSEPQKSDVAVPQGRDQSQRRSATQVWVELGINAAGLANAGGVPYATVANIAAILSQDVGVRLSVWFDEFKGRIYCTEDGRERPWTDADDLVVLEYINRTLQLPQVGLKNVSNAVQLVAHKQRRNSVTRYLKSLTWDRTERLSAWLTDCLSCPNTAYTQAVARNWLISMVARAFKPGCQADHMPVLEGASGRGKSSALAILGGDWYRAAPQDFGSKAFLEVIQGAWLVEIPDMVGFGRREHTQIIAAITTRSDSYRAAYARHAEEHPRTAIFAATSETDDYLQDSRGLRRYWPLRCGDIDLTLLTAMRDQLLAEALCAFEQRARWHETPAQETQHEQHERQEIDPWHEQITDYLASRDYASIRDIAEMCLSIKAERQDRIMQNRIVKCLKMLGYVRTMKWSNGKPHKLWKRCESLSTPAILT